jgi:hypothetical protein
LEIGSSKGEPAIPTGKFSPFLMLRIQAILVRSHLVSIHTFSGLIYLPGIMLMPLMPMMMMEIVSVRNKDRTSLCGKDDGHHDRHPFQKLDKHAISPFDPNRVVLM